MSRVNYGLWIWRVVSWDTLLPAAMLLAPRAIVWLAPNRWGLITLAAVSLPILAFLLRLHAGGRQIAGNHCSANVRRIQFSVLFVGIIPLVLFDCFMFIGAVANGKPDNETIMFLFVLVCIYLSAMVIAMYPGRRSEPAISASNDDWGDPGSA